MNCFAQGVEKDGHKCTHPYHIINKLNFPLLDKEWTAEEELLLVEGLERFGFGNWLDISEHLGGEKTKEEVEQHYENIYINSPNFLPTKSMILSQRNKQTLELKVNSQFPLKKQGVRPRPSRSQPQANNCMHPATRTTMPSHSHHQQQGNNANVNNNNNSIAEIVGFLPKRGDFDYEYDNDAELLLAEMEFNEDDNETEIQMKHKILDIYNARLDERIKRKQFVIERDILDYHKQAILEKTRTKEEKEIYNLMKVFARFNTPEDHEQLIQGIIKEKSIRQKIDELNQYRKQGFRTFDQVNEALQEKARSDEEYQNRMKQLDQYCIEQSNLNDFSQQSKIEQQNTSKRTTRITKEQNEKEEKKYLGLKEEEIKLAESLGLQIYDYILIRDVILREAVKQAFISKEYIENLIKIDKFKLTAIFDYLVKHNDIMEKQ